MIERHTVDDTSVLRLAHGKASALDLELLGALREALEAEAAAPERALVLTGTGSIFSAGVDLVRLVEGGADYLARFLPALDAALLALVRLAKPVVAAVNGHAIAGGCVVACGCDLRLMAAGSGRMGAPELKVGVPFPPVALELVLRAMAPHHARVALLRGTLFTPEERRERGLVDEVVEPDELLPRALERARELAAVPARAYALNKRLLVDALHADLERRAAAAAPEVLATWSSPEVLDAVRGYVERTLGK